MTMRDEVAGPDGSALSEGLGVTVGDAVMLRADLYEGPDEHAPGGYLARRGEKLIVRKLHSRCSGPHPIDVSHEHRTDGITFCVSADEIEPWRVTPNVF
jgi:hypothetical protein